MANSTAPSTLAPKRKSWFSLRRHDRMRSDQPLVAAGPPPSAFNHEMLNSPRSSCNPVGPMQFAPNRIGTLYVTPSERSLYLAAMAHLDHPPQALPLWSDPAPTLPALPMSPASSQRGRLFRGTPHPLTTLPLSPKLVTSPNLPYGTGLQIRDEFRVMGPPDQNGRHALMSLAPNSFVRFSGFPAIVLLALDQCISENWPRGVWMRSHGVDELRRHLDKSGEGLTWRIELHGNPWKRKGSQELETIRLMLALLTTLGVHGWSLVNTVQAAGVKKESMNLLFSHSDQTEALPPAFFALSLPLADRLSIISPPNKVTPALITAARNAINSNSHLTGHSRAGTGSSGLTTSSDESKGPLWGRDGGVKLEGWVHPGVYRFWIGGMRRWMGAGVKQTKVDRLHPQLLVSLLNNITANHFALAGSLPLFPLSKGRDVLYFSSLPASGLSHLNTYRASGADTAGSESPVMISSTESLPPAHLPEAGNIQPAPVRMQTPPSNPTVFDAGSPKSNRVLPWSSVLAEDPPTSPRHRKYASDSSAAPPPPSAMPSHSTREPRERRSSQDSAVPLIPSSAQSSPKPRNVLLKKISLRSRQSASGRETPVDSRQAQPTPSPEDRDWTIVNPPASIGALGLSTFSAGPPAAQPVAHGPTIRDPSAYPPARRSIDTASGESIYEDPDDTAMPITNIIPLGRPMMPYPESPAASQTIPRSQQLRQAPVVHIAPVAQPLHLPVRGAVPSKRAGSAVIDVGSGIGAPSMHGSFGTFGRSQSIVSGISGHGGSSSFSAHGAVKSTAASQDSPALSVPPPLPSKPTPEEMRARPGSSKTKFTMGKSKGKSTY